MALCASEFDLSQGVIKALSSPFITAMTVSECQKRLSLLERSNKVTLHWVP